MKSIKNWAPVVAMALAAIIGSCKTTDSSQSSTKEANMEKLVGKAKETAFKGLERFTPHSNHQRDYLDNYGIAIGKLTNTAKSFELTPSPDDWKNPFVLLLFRGKLGGTVYYGADPRLIDNAISCNLGLIGCEGEVQDIGIAQITEEPKYLMVGYSMHSKQVFKMKYVPQPNQFTKDVVKGYLDLDEIDFKYDSVLASSEYVYISQSHLQLSAIMLQSRWASGERVACVWPVYKRGHPSGVLGKANCRKNQGEGF